MRCTFKRWGWPLLLGLSALQAQAQLAPFSVGISETLTWQNNLLRASSDGVSDLQSNTTLQGGYEQDLGAQRFKASASVSLYRLRTHKELDNTGYQLGGEWGWIATELLSGEVGASALQRRYQYGPEGETPLDTKSMERNRQLYARARLGGITDWTWSAGATLSTHGNSALALQTQDYRQQGLDLGGRYQSNPDLTLSSNLRINRTRYDTASPTLGIDDFRTDAIDVGADWNASGASTLSARIGYSQEHHDLLSDRSYWNGSLRWNWTPSPLLQFGLGVRRDTSALNQSIAGSTVVTRSLNDVVDLSVRWQATALISLDLTGQSARRGFDESLGGGHDRLATYGLGARYAATDAISLDCRVSHERRGQGDTVNPLISRPYSARIVSCGAQLQLR